MNDKNKLLTSQSDELASLRTMLSTQGFTSGGASGDFTATTTAPLGNSLPGSGAHAQQDDEQLMSGGGGSMRDVINKKVRVVMLSRWKEF